MKKQKQQISLVIFFNRAVEGDEDEGKVLGSYDKCAFVGTDAPEAGHMQGEMIGNYLVDNYDAVDLNGDGKISYAMFMGQLGNVEAIYRTQYGVEDANKVLEENGKKRLWNTLMLLTLTAIRLTRTVTGPQLQLTTT